MRNKILLGFVALTASLFLWVVHNNLESITQKSSDVKDKITTIKGTDEDVITDLTPLEKVYNQLELGMSRQEALGLVDKEYPIKYNGKNYSVDRNNDGTYFWRWDWEKIIDTNTIEKATLIISFTREGHCVMCKVANATYVYKKGSATIKRGLRADIPVI